MDFDTIYKIIDFISTILSGIASGIAIYLFIFKRKTISSIIHFLLNYSCQISLTELREKLERLNELSADDEKQNIEIVNILNEIAGQIRGNPILNKKCDEILKTISKYAEKTKILTEPKKRSIVWELRENLRSIDIQTYNELCER